MQVFPNIFHWQQHSVTATNWRVSSFSMHKNLLYQMARKFCAKTPTLGFKDLLLWNFQSSLPCKWHPSTKQHRRVCESSPSHCTLASSLTVLHVRRHHITQWWWNPGNAVIFWIVRMLYNKLVKKTPAFQGSLLCSIHLTTEYKEENAQDLQWFHSAGWGVQQQHLLAHWVSSCRKGKK